MLENILTISVTGFLAGFIFSMPVAGPISIIITSKALEGKLRFCARTAIGNVIAEFLYIMLAVFGIATLYPYYKPAIPYLLLAGSILSLTMGIRILKTKIELTKIDTKKIITDKLANRGGFRIGFFLSLTNPTLFLGWLVTSFMVFSFVSSLGFETGGLEKALNSNVDAVSQIAGPEFNHEIKANPENEKTNEGNESISVVLLTIIYALTAAVGGLAWLYGYARFVVRHRSKLNIDFINRLIQALGIILCFLSIYLFYKGIASIS
ncbi:MAG: hypothetical protein D8M58_20300 [Calditrichaeota bacterium]|nr:MAG: hypothetical protein DWQ03_14285 [Calditrichota bacterium]MBL1207753.1 hypothetical protein [Calditrichota bacterium]NOG47587.1 LysE family transporter [Calditrichota bacterium]